MAVECVVYLLHLQRPLPGGGRHYIGMCPSRDLPGRLDRHRHGQGARMLALANTLDISYVLVRTWPDGGRPLERALKRQHMARLCPLCRGIALHRHAEGERRRRAARVAVWGA